MVLNGNYAATICLPSMDDAAPSSCFFIYGLEKYEYTAGITNSVSIPANTSPPTTTIPSDVLLPEDVPSESAIGSVPNIIASVVIKIGRKRETAAAKTASFTDIP